MTVKRPGYLSAVMLAIMLVIAGGCAGEVAESPPEYTVQVIEDISVQEAYDLIRANEGNPDFEIIDVRTPQEYAEGHLENSLLIDFYEDTFREDLDMLDKNKRYLIYCRSGNRSGQARDIMQELGFKEVYNMVGGIVQWQADKLPLVK